MRHLPGSGHDVKATVNALRLIRHQEAIRTLHSFHTQNKEDNCEDPSKLEHSLGLVRKARQIFRIVIGDNKALGSLIWHEVEGTRFLTWREEHGEKGKLDRRLRAVIRQFRHNNWTFEGLAVSAQGPKQRTFFEACAKIERAFDWNLFAPPLLVIPKEDELNRSHRRGTFYIKNGNHRLLVLAYRYLKEKCKFEPFECWLLTPRPEENDESQHTAVGR